MIPSSIAGLRSPLGRRLVLVTILFSSCITLVLTAVQLFLIYQEDVGVIETELDRIPAVHLPTLAESLWAVDQGRLKVQLDGIYRLRDMQYLALREGDTLWAEAGTPGSARMLQRDYPVVYRDRGMDRRLGTLTVVAHLDGVYRHLYAQVLTIFVSNGIKTFLVALFMFALFHRIAINPLVSLTEYVTKAGSQWRGLRWRLQRRRSGPPDEFDALKLALDRMQENLEQTYARLGESEARFRGLFEQAADGAVVLERGTGRILDVNARIARLSGYSRDELLRMTAMETAPVEERELIAGKLREIAASGEVVFERTLMRRDGKRVAIEINARLIEIEGQNIILSQVRDLTERQRAEEALGESAQRLRLAVQAAKLHHWEWQIDTDTLIWDRDPAPLLGEPDGASGAYPDFRTLVHLEDRDRFLAAGRAALDHDQPYDIEFRIVRRDAEVRWLAAAGIVTRDANGRAQRMLGVTRDITARKLSDEETVRQLEELRRWHAVMLGREDRNMELKREVNELLRRLSEPPRYPSAE